MSARLFNQGTILGRPPAADGVARMNDLTDDELIATLVAHGQPHHSAVALRTNPQLRLCAARFWADVQNAPHDPQSRERVEYCREAWNEMRKADIISNNPDRYV